MSTPKPEARGTSPQDLAAAKQYGIAPEDLVGRVLPSINEPPGSTVYPPEVVEPPELLKTKPAVTQEPPLPDNDKLHAMLRRELEELAADRSVDVEDARTKEDIIEALRRDARRRHR